MDKNTEIKMNKIDKTENTMIASNSLKIRIIISTRNFRHLPLITTENIITDKMIDRVASLLYKTLTNNCASP